VPTPEDDDLFLGHLVDKPVRELVKRRLPNLFLNFSITEGEKRNLRNRSVNHPDKVKAKPGSPLVVPVSGFLDIGGGSVTENDPSRHEYRR
jgi:hypothetical protein